MEFRDSGGAWNARGAAPRRHCFASRPGPQVLPVKDEDARGQVAEPNAQECCHVSKIQDILVEPLWSPRLKL